MATKKRKPARKTSRRTPPRRADGTFRKRKSRGRK